MRRYLHIVWVLFIIAIGCLLLLSCPSQEEDMQDAILPYTIFYDSIKTPCDDYVVVDFGQLSVHMFCSDEVGREQFKKRHGVDRTPTAGWMWNNGIKYEVWSHMTRLPNGKYTPNVFTIGHELTHAVDWKLNRQGLAFGNPDKVFK